MIGTKFSKYFKQDIVDKNQTLKPVIVIPELEEEWAEYEGNDTIAVKKIRSVYAFTTNQENLIERWPYEEYEDKPLEQIACLKSVSNVRISNDWDRKTLKINRLRFQLHNQYDAGRKLSEVIRKLNYREVRLYYKSPTTNIINYYPDVLHPDIQDEDDDFYNYNCPFIFKGHITRVKVQKDIISITAEDSTESFISQKMVPRQTLDYTPTAGYQYGADDPFDFVNPSFNVSDIGYPLVYGYVDKSPVIQATYKDDDRSIQLITGKISGHYPTSKIPALLTNKKLPSGNSYCLYVKAGEDYIILDHMPATDFDESDVLELYLTGGGVGGGGIDSPLLPIILGHESSVDKFGLYDMVGFQQRMVDASYGSTGGILGIESATEYGVDYPLDFNHMDTDNLGINKTELNKKWYRLNNISSPSFPVGTPSPILLDTEFSYMSDTTQMGDGKYLMLKLSKGVDNELVNIYDGDGSFIGNTFIMSDYWVQNQYPSEGYPDTDDIPYPSGITGMGWFVAPISSEVLNAITQIRGNFNEDIVVDKLNSRQLSLQALLAETPDQLESLVVKAADGTFNEVEELVAPKLNAYVNACIISASSAVGAASGQSKFWGNFTSNPYLNQTGEYKGVNGLYFGAKTQVNQDILVGESPSVHNNMVMFEYFPPHWTTESGGTSLSYENELLTSTTAFLHSVKVEDVRIQEMYGSFIGRKNHRSTEWVDPNTEYMEPVVPEGAEFEDLIKNSNGTTPNFAAVIEAYCTMFKNIINTNAITKTKPYADQVYMYPIGDDGLEYFQDPQSDTSYAWYSANWGADYLGGYDPLGWHYSEYGGNYDPLLWGDGMTYDDFQNFLDGSAVNYSIESEFANFQSLGLGDAPMLTNYTLFRNFIYEYCQIPMRMAHDFNFLFDTQGHNINMIGYDWDYGWFGHPQIIKHMLAYIYQVDLSEVEMPLGGSYLNYYYRWKWGTNSQAYMIKETLNINSLMSEYMTEDPIGYQIESLDGWISNFYVYMDDVIQAFNHCLRDLEEQIGATVYNEEGAQEGNVFHYDGYPQVTGDNFWDGRENFSNWVSGNQWYYGLSYYETGTELSGLRSELALSLYEEEDIVGEPYLTSGVVQKPSDIVLDIIESEMNYDLGINYENVDQDSIDKSRHAHVGWSMGFSRHKRVNGKKLIEEVLRESKSYPTFISDGKFSLITIKEQYDEEDVYKTIREADIINYNFSQTKIENIVTSIKAYYNYDHGMKDYTHFEYQNIADYNTYYDHSPPYMDEGEGGAFNMSDEDIRENNAGHLELHLKYHTDKSTVDDFIKHTIMNNCLPHSVCELTLSLNNMDIDIGSVIRLPLIQGEKIPSVGSQRDILHVNKYTGETEEFATNYEANSPLDYTKSNLRNGVEIYPYWIVMEKETGINGVKLKAYQLHNLIPIEAESGLWQEHDEDPDDPVIPVYGNMHPVNLNFYFDTGAPIPNWNFNPNATVHQGPEIPYFDINGDGHINIVDIISVVNHILDYSQLDTDQLVRLNTYTLDGSSGDSYVNIIDVIAMIDIIVGAWDD